MKIKRTLLLFPLFLIVITVNAQSSRCVNAGDQAKSEARLAAAKAAALDETVAEHASASPGTGAVSCSKSGAACCSKAGSGATAGVQSPGGNSPEAGNSVAQRAACSSAFSKAKANSRKASIPVKLVSNWQ